MVVGKNVRRGVCRAKAFDNSIPPKSQVGEAGQDLRQKRKRFSGFDYRNINGARSRSQ
jgi:hypothetical protein